METGTVVSFDDLLKELKDYAGLDEMVGRLGIGDAEIKVLLEKSKKNRGEFIKRATGLIKDFVAISQDWVALPNASLQDDVLTIGEKRYCYSEENIAFFEKMTARMKRKKEYCLNWLSFCNELLQFDCGGEILSSLLPDENGKNAQGYEYDAMFGRVAINGEFFDISGEDENCWSGGRQRKAILIKYERLKLMVHLWEHEEKAFQANRQRNGIGAAREILKSIGVPENLENAITLQSSIDKKEQYIKDKLQKARDEAEEFYKKHQYEMMSG